VRERIVVNYFPVKIKFSYLVSVAIHVESWSCLLWKGAYFAFSVSIEIIPLWAQMLPVTL